MHLENQVETNMRVAVVCIVVALSLTIPPGIECNVSNLHLSDSDYPIDSYKNFIKILCYSLNSGQYYSKDLVPILRPSAPDSKRFHLIILTSDQDETITAAIDVVDASIAAYCAGNRSYFFSNAPQIAYRILFTNTTQTTMDFDNTFTSLETAAGITRSQIPLGEAPFDIATSSLYHHESVPESFLVIIQMVIEASKFRFIKQHVVNSLKDGTVFLPSLAILSLEDNWSELSFQIQASDSSQGLFGKEVFLYNSNDEPIPVDSIHYPIVHSNLVYELYTCHVPNILKMPGSVKDDITRQNNKCQIEPQTSRISGRDGMCVDVAGALVEDGSPVILYPCGEQVNQKWTFYPDGTIRSLGKCLAGGNTNTNSVVIYDCDKASKKDIDWWVRKSGRIMRVYSERPLTATSAAISTKLTEELDTFGADQAWRVGNYVKPFIVSIVGLKEMCLEATNGNTNIWLEDCVKNKEEQSWALYSDGTIRVNQNRSLCVTASVSSKVINIDSCNGSFNQRWNLYEEGKISMDYSVMYMDVAENDVYLKKLVVSRVNYQDSQQWVILY